MSRVSWATRQDLGEHWRVAWANADGPLRAEHFVGSPREMAERFEAWLVEATVVGEDVFVLPAMWVQDGYGALVSDMDSTLIVGESLDELAHALGVGEQVAAITARSMRGELDFAQALDQRFQLIRDVPKSAFEELGQQTVLSRGASVLIQTLVRGGTHCTLATGGFDTVAEPVVKRLGMHDYVANTLAFDTQGRFAGRLAADVLDATAKLATLLDRRARFGCGKPCLAMGDGANDLAMIEAAEIGIAYRAKPIVRQTTAYQLNFADLEGLCFLLGLDA